MAKWFRRWHCCKKPVQPMWVSLPNHSNTKEYSMNIRRFFIVALSFLSWNALAGGPDTPSVARKFFIEMAMGQQGVHAVTEVTPIEGDDFIPFDRKDIMERVALGYSLFHFLNVEAGMTFFSGYAYKIASSQN